MVRSIQLSVAALALLMPLACSSAGGPTRVEPATPAAATRAAAVPPEVAPGAAALQAAIGAANANDGPTPQPPTRAAAPLTVINQMVTTQALLVSLLLAPVSHEAGHPPASPARAN